MRKKETGCHRALKITHILSYGGFVLMPLSLVFGAMVDTDVVMVILGGLGFISVMFGLIFGNIYVKCPKCEHSLMQSGRVPGKLPNYCPHCGIPL